MLTEKICLATKQFNNESQLKRLWPEQNSENIKYIPSVNFKLNVPQRHGDVSTQVSNRRGG